MATVNENESVCGEYTTLDGDRYYQIRRSHLMPEFFMSLVGADDHWMFVSSSGALTAGRRNPDFALFPYAADDQLTAMRDSTGPLTLIRTDSTLGPSSDVWEPFREDAKLSDHLERNLYKSALGNKVVFEECNSANQLTFRYRWTFSPRFGFVRDCWLENNASKTQRIEIVDGLQNLLPYGVGSEFSMRFSNLANAYKKSELVQPANIGLCYLSSIPTDRAEPSEGLRATVAWQVGLKPDACLLSVDQIDRFRSGEPLVNETNVRGKPGAFMVSQTLELDPDESIHWHIMADLSKDQTDVIELDQWLRSTNDPKTEINADVEEGEKLLRRIVGSADGIQCGQNSHRTNRHLGNTIFNLMRGGVPLDNYQVDKNDFVQGVKKFNQETFERHRILLEHLPVSLDSQELNQQLTSRKDPDLIRLGLEYLPLSFSRRHGDPTRPWNRFSIDIRMEDGRSNLNYQGNWRDIFQNWEALAISFPEFLTAMICRFVNATTADGYNPYRITKDGVEWEEPAPEDPWSNIGYWCDHQIIYLLKLLEWNHRFHPEEFRSLLNSAVFVNTEIPYRIKSFEDIQSNPRETIDFDWELARDIEGRFASLGADGKLLRDRQQSIQHVTLIEKLLALSLAKLANFVPDGGIWLNTQRPEWNDANNALVGNGLSMVTTAYLHRWFKFLIHWIGEASESSFSVSVEVAKQFKEISGVLKQAVQTDMSTLGPTARESIVVALSEAGSNFRMELYDHGPSGEITQIHRDELLDMLECARRVMELSIRNNKRNDALYHAYNIIDWTENGIEIDNLCVMLEGQVAVLSSGVLSARETNLLLDALRSSELYRENQESYLLYPDKNLPTFLDKNKIPNHLVESNPLLKAMVDANFKNIVARDVCGDYHFNGSFRNASDVREALANLPGDFDDLVADHGDQVDEIFETVFGHKHFTGRSGTFFAYEGLGSIYWHMVSKLGLAVSENIDWAIERGESSEIVNSLKEHLQAIRRGIGAEKSPTEYGAFPSDPYSHTPENAGVKQPGMTGQVKEDVLARFAELGVEIKNGRLGFRLELFDQNELLDEPDVLTFHNLSGAEASIELPKNGFGFTLFQTPILYVPAVDDSVLVVREDGFEQVTMGHDLSAEDSLELFRRSGKIIRLECRWAALSEGAN